MDKEIGGRMAVALSKAKQYEKTRSALLTVAHELFAKKGYAATFTQDIVERAGVTRGALYYHFQSKAGLFQAVFEDLRHSRLQMILERIQTAEGDLWQRLVQTGDRSNTRGERRLAGLPSPPLPDFLLTSPLPRRTMGGILIFSKLWPSLSACL